MHTSAARARLTISPSFSVGLAKIIDGASPYVFNADKTFAYPPFLGWLVAPLHPLSSSRAAIVWTLLSVVAVGLALWLLELRDWRCYALVGVFIFTRSAIDLGTIEPLLLLAVAAAWRWRDRLSQPAAAIGVAIVLKLFLWPLAVWLALTRRVRAAAAAVGFAVVLAVSQLGCDRVRRHRGLSRRPPTARELRVDVVLLRRRTRSSRALARRCSADPLGADRARTPRRGGVGSARQASGRHAIATLRR